MIKNIQSAYQYNNDSSYNRDGKNNSSIDATHTSAVYLLQMKVLNSLFLNMTRDMLVLKGGMAMRMLTGVQRHTKDIDMAGDPDIPVATIRKHMESAIRKAIASGLIDKGSFREQDARMNGLSPKWHINGFITGTNTPVHLTIEVSRRDKLPDEAITKINFEPGNGMQKFVARTYSPLAMSASKVAALLDDSRNAPRDVFDLYILITSYVDSPVDLIAALGKDKIEDKINKLWDKLDYLNYQLFLSEVKPTLPKELAEKIDESEWDSMRIEVGEAVKAWLDEAYSLAEDEIPRIELRDRLCEIKTRRECAEHDLSESKIKSKRKFS